MSRTMYFIGNVLPDADAASKHPESGTKSFHIDQDESRGMDLTGLPIRLEHSDSLNVGTIREELMDGSGKKWVVGEIDNNTVQSSFVGKDLMSKNAIFTGLSLQHVYREFSDGSSSKTPVEVSLCREPRRAGCNVAVVRATITEKPNYKPTNCTPVVQMASNAQETTPAPVEVPAANNAPAEPEQPLDPEKARLMQEVLSSVEEQDRMAKELKEAQDKLQGFEKEQEDRAKRKANEEQQYISNLASSVMEQIVNLSPELKNKDTDEAINELARSHPDQIKRVLEIAHCASKRNAELEQQMKRQTDDFERRLVEQKYEQAMKRKAGVHVPTEVNEPTASLEVKASKRQRTSNPYACDTTTANKYSISGEAGDSASASQIREAYNALRGSGSLNDCMKNVSGILGTQRQAGFR